MPEDIPGVTQSPQSSDLFAKANEFVGGLFKPIGQPLGQVFGKVGAQISPTWEKAFQTAGEQLPRLGAEAAFTGGQGWLPKAVGFGDVALQSMGESADKGLTAPQRIRAAAAQTGAFAVAPKLGGVGEEVASKLAQPVAAKLPTTAGALALGAARKGGSILGTLGAFETANKVSADIMNQPYDPLTPEHLAGTAAAVLPFEVLGVPHMFQQFKSDKNKLWYDHLQKSVQAEDAAKSPILTQQRETEDVQTPAQAVPLAMEHNPDEVKRDTERYWALYNAPMTSTSWQEMDAIKAKYGGKPPMKPLKVRQPLTRSTNKQWKGGLISGDDIKQELVNGFNVPEKVAHDAVRGNYVDNALDNFRINNAEELKEARRDDDEENFWKNAVGDIAEDVYGQLKNNKKLPPSSPTTQETRTAPQEFLNTEAKLRGPFALSAPQRMHAEFGGKFDPAQVYGRLQNTLTPDEFKFFDSQGLMDQLTKAKSGKEVAKWMQAVGPKVEVKKSGEGSLHPDQKAFMEYQHHWFDGLTEATQRMVLANNERGVPFPADSAPKFLEAAQKYHDLFQKSRAVPFNPAEAHWSSISPKPESEMPGYVEGAVTLPTGGPNLGRARQKFIDEYHQEPNDEQLRMYAKEGERGEDIKFPSSHSFPPNTLGFFRGYMEPRPDGGKTFHVVEVQSDWAQQKRNESDPKVGGHVQGHPLLRDYERLTLKAAIDHAIKEGADRIAVSDAETAMMTEGHDRQHTGGIASLPKPEEAIPQAKGMRLHYDTTLPRTLEELTGKKGEKKEYGEHKMARSEVPLYAPPSSGFETREDAQNWIDDTAAQRQQGLYRIREQGDRLFIDTTIPHRQDLIFKTPEGQPKTSISATEFPLDKLKSLDKPFSLFGRDKLTSRLGKPFTQETLLDLGRLDDFLDPQDTIDTAERMAAFDRRPKESLLDFMTRSLGLHVDLNKPAKPEELLHNAKTLIENYTKNVLGMDETRSAYWTEKYLKLVQMVGHAQKETRMMPALPYTRDAQLKAASFYAPSRGELPNAFIGIFQHTAHTPDRAMFEFFHSTAHELFHGAMMQAEGKTFTGEIPEKVLDAAKGVAKLIDDLKLSTEEMGQTIHSTLRMMAGSPYKSLLDYRYKHYTEDAAGRMEFAADFFGLQAMGAASPRTLKPFKAVEDLLKFTNDDVREFARGVFRDFGVMLDFLGDLVRKIFGWKPTTVNVIKDLAGNMRKLMQSADEADKATEAFLRHQDIRDARPWAPISGVDYNRVEQLFMALGNEATDKDVDVFRKEAAVLAVPMTDKDLPEELGLGKRLKAWNFLDPQLYRSIPLWADVRWIGRNLNNLARESAMNMFEHWVDPITQKYNVDAIVRMGQNGNPLNKAFNEIKLREGALSGPDSGQRLSVNTVRGMKEYQALSPDDKVFLDRFLDQYSASMGHAAILRVGSLKNDIGHKVARAFQNIDPKMGAEEAKDLGKALTATFVDVDRMANGMQNDDPKEQMSVSTLFREYGEAQKTLATWAQKDPLNAQRLQSVSEIFTHKDGKPLPPGEVPDIAKKFTQFRELLLGKWTAPEKPGEVWHFQGKPGYSPEVRLGRWHIAWKDKNGNPQGDMIALDKKEDFDAKMRTLYAKQAKGELEYLKPFDKEDQKDLFRGLRPDMYNTLVEAITSTNNQVIEKIKQLNPGATEVLDELRDELKPARMVINALIEAPYMKQRRLIGGRETLNMLQGGIHYINSTSYTIGKTNSRGEQALLLNDPKMLANPNLRKYARQYFSEITDPTEKWFGWFKNLMSANYIFLSPSLAFVEFTQQMTNHLPALLNAGMDARGAVKAIKDANVAMAQAWARGGYKKDHIYETPEKTEAVRWAVKNNIIDSGWLSELFPLGEDLPFINARNHLVGDGSVLDRTGLIGKSLYHGYKFARDAHGLAIRVNQEAAFTSSWEHLRTQVDPKTGQKYSGQSLLRAAAELTDESMHGGGRATRPLWYLGIGQPNFGANAGGLMYFLQTYVYSTVSQMLRYSKNAISNSGLSESERLAAGKAAAAMVGSQMFLAGVMGLPIMGQVFALIEQAFPNTEPKRRAREMFFGIGKWLNSKVHLAAQDDQMGHFVADTALDGLSSQLTPWNMSNRFELGVLLGVDPYKGFSWGNVVGPGGNLLEQMLLKPAQALAEGRTTDAAIEAIPNSNVRRLATLASNGWNLRNKDDRQNLELSGGEAASYAMGFTPKRVKEFQDLNAMKIRAEAVQALEQKKFHSDLAAQLMNGQVGEVRSALLQRARDVENYDPTEGAKQIAELVRQRSEDFDPMREGSRSGGTYNVGQLFEGPSAASTSEVQRLRQKQALVQALGFRSSLGMSSLREAELVDRLVALHPGLSKLQAKVMLERQLQPRKFAYPGREEGQ